MWVHSGVAGARAFVVVGPIEAWGTGARRPGNILHPAESQSERPVTALTCSRRFAAI